jgi:hypothetical protein
MARLPEQNTRRLNITLSLYAERNRVNAVLVNIGFAMPGGASGRLIELMRAEPRTSVKG